MSIKAAMLRTRCFSMCRSRRIWWQAQEQRVRGSSHAKASVLREYARQEHRIKRPWIKENAHRSAPPHISGMQQSCRECLNRVIQAAASSYLRRSVGRRAVSVSSSAAKQPLDLRLKVRHILLPHNQADLFEQLQQQLEDGAKFEELAARHSVCLSASRGGALGGWLKRGVVPQMFEDAAYDAEVGEITTAETDKGLHIIQVIDRREVAEETKVRSMRVEELGELLAAPNAPAGLQLIDVREPFEHDIAALPHFQLLPMSRMEAWLPTASDTLDSTAPTVVLCHAGVRSNMVAHALIQQGFQDVSNVVGGIEAYSCLVDSSVPRY